MAPTEFIRWFAFPDKCNKFARLMKLVCRPAIIPIVRDHAEDLQLEVLNHGVAPVW